MNVALFENARVHDIWAIYQRDTWIERPADGAHLSPAVRLLATPGHTAQDLTTLVDTDSGTVALTHLWWDVRSQSDPLAEDPDALHAGRTRVLKIAALVVPGHGAPFTPADLIGPSRCGRSPRASQIGGVGSRRAREGGARSQARGRTVDELCGAAKRFGAAIRPASKRDGASEKVIQT
jgi:glyoxylase-like metal-dependent hydrolase (beta-lactamase superfamily II)